MGIPDDSENELLSKENAIALEDALVWLRDKHRHIIIDRPIPMNAIDLAKYLTQYEKYKNDEKQKIIELATTIIDDVNYYQGANLVNDEIKTFQLLIGRQECYKTYKICRHNCHGQCKESC